MLKPKCKLCGGDCGLICKKFAAEAPKPKLRAMVNAVPAKKLTKSIHEAVKKTKPSTKKPRKPILRAGRPKKGTEDKTLSAQRPWKEAGISRRTWYRQRGGQ